MSIVAISQSLGSLGDEIGRKLARALSYEFADREIILRAAERFGEGVKALEHATEERPTLWERFTETQRRYLTFIEAIIWEMAARDDVILSGRGGPFILRNVRHALRVKITALAGVRAKRVEGQGLTPEAAVHAVHQSDRERAARIRFLFHTDWDDPLLYDLVLNTDRLDANVAVGLVQSALQDERFQPTQDSLNEVKNLSVVAQAKAALLAHPLTRQLQLSLACENGHVTITGIVERKDLEKAAVEVVGTIPGVIEVRSEIAVVAQHSYRPAV